MTYKPATKEQVSKVTCKRLHHRLSCHPSRRRMHSFAARAGRHIRPRLAECTHM